MIDWLEQAPDLPHLIAHVSERVLSHGHAPEGLVVVPRAGLDRRELATYCAGWADVVDEELPAVREAYEQRITAAHLQGQEDARTGRRPRRARRAGDERDGGEVLTLPYIELLCSPSELTRVEQRGERERTLADGPPARDSRGERAVGERNPPAAQAALGRSERAQVAPAQAAPVEDEPGSAVGILLCARELRERRPAAAERRPVLRRNGRPSVPPPARQNDTPGKARRPGPPDTPPRDEGRPRLSDRARALDDELEGRASSPAATTANRGHRYGNEAGRGPAQPKKCASWEGERAGRPFEASGGRGPVAVSGASGSPPSVSPSSPSRYSGRGTGVGASGWSPSSELTQANIQLAAARWSTAAASRWSVTDQSAPSPCSSRLRALSRGRCLTSTESRRAERRSRCQSSRSMP